LHKGLPVSACGVAQHSAKRGHIAVHDRAGAHRRIVIPESIYDLTECYRPVGVQRQHRKQPPRARTSDRDHVAIHNDLNRAEQLEPDVHGVFDPSHCLPLTRVSADEATPQQRMMRAVPSNSTADGHGFTLMAQRSGQYVDSRATSTRRSREGRRGAQSGKTVTLVHQSRSLACQGHSPFTAMSQKNAHRMSGANGTGFTPSVEPEPLST